MTRADAGATLIDGCSPADVLPPSARFAALPLQRVTSRMAARLSRCAVMSDSPYAAADAPVSRRRAWRRVQRAGAMRPRSRVASRCYGVAPRAALAQACSVVALATIELRTAAACEVAGVLAAEPSACVIGARAWQSAADDERQLRTS